MQSFRRLRASVSGEKQAEKAQVRDRVTLGLLREDAKAEAALKKEERSDHYTQDYRERTVGG